MAYFNNYTGFYPTPSTREEFSAHQFLDQTSAAEGVNYEGSHVTFSDYWNTFQQPEPTAGSSAALPVTVGHESLAPATSYTNQTGSYDQLSYSSHYWPEVGQQAQTYHPGSSSQNFSPAIMAAPEPSTVVPTPSSAPLGYWGESQSGPSTSAFYTENAHTYHQSGTGLTRTELPPTERFQPYAMARARKHRNAEAGPSTLVPSSVPYAGHPTQQPSGGVISETTADAEHDKIITEEHKLPRQKSKQAKRPRGPLRPHRVQMRGDATRLHDWVQQRKGLLEALSFNAALAIAAETIPTIRPLVYLEPRLAIGHSKRTQEGVKNADNECERRNVERRLYQELSKYYLLGQNQSAWARPALLSNVVQDLEGLPALPGPSNQPPP